MLQLRILHWSNLWLTILKRPSPIVLLTLSSPGCLEGDTRSALISFLCAVWTFHIMHSLKVILDTTSCNFSLKATVLTFQCRQKRNLGKFSLFPISSRWLFSQTSGFIHKRLDLEEHDAPHFATFCKNWELWKERRNYISEWILVEQVRAGENSQSPSDSWSQSFNLAPSIKSSLKILPQIPFSKTDLKR